MIHPLFNLFVFRKIRILNSEGAFVHFKVITLAVITVSMFCIVSDLLYYPQ